MHGKEDQLDAILAPLDRHRQRATYTAVGGVVGLPAQSVMQGRPKTSLNSWVVSKARLLPTGYAALECHPKISVNAHVIQTPDELRGWLDGHS